MPRIILCDRCGKSTKEDRERGWISRRKCRWERFEVDDIIDGSDFLYLCGDCAKEFKQWMLNKPHVNVTVPKAPWLAKEK